MPVDFLSDGEAARYGQYCGPPSQVELEKVFLNDADKKLIKACRGPRNRLGYALQLTTVRRYLERRSRPVFDALPAIAGFFEQLVAARCTGEHARWGVPGHQHARRSRRRGGRGLAALVQAAGEEIVAAAASNWATLGAPDVLAVLECDADRRARFLEHEIAACQESGAVDGGTHILFACGALGTE